MGIVPRLFAVTVDCPDPMGLARFYRSFLGGELHSTNDDFVVLVRDGEVRLDFQRVANPEAAPWPDPRAARRLHLDFAVDDLAEAEERLLGLGAALADVQPGGERFRVLLDPAGHPFCVVTASAASVG
ncbi:VOC family protein [Actinoallomurus iriomotensis]|uniref:VOC domain-containing protein n=1 Tax=Actinoallomurus iriomotensis TaxID=478107 RepID=A0A9W6VN18_9ACTN|nr:VOC family protein [Actinoallomurus iriomotensis]GLY78293.1 hypothetical protein Airi01_065600 [Actinoallomurus iriomotensis]